MRSALVIIFLAMTPNAGENYIREIAESGRCADLGQDPDTRVARPAALAPGLPPLLSFRYYEGKLHYRFNDSDLMLDDASH